MHQLLSTCVKNSSGHVHGYTHRVVKESESDADDTTAKKTNLNVPLQRNKVTECLFSETLKVVSTRQG